MARQPHLMKEFGALVSITMLKSSMSSMCIFIIFGLSQAFGKLKDIEIGYDCFVNLPIAYFSIYEQHVSIFG